MQGSVLFHKRVVHNKYYLSWEYFKYFKSENRFYILPNKQNRIGFIPLETKERATRISLKSGVKSDAQERLSSSFCSTCGTRRVTLVTNPVINHD
jgi:hypothetical protein